MSIGRWTTRRAYLQPEDTAIISDDGRAYTYEEFNNRVNQVANGFREIGITHGERIASLFPNNPEFLEILFAAAKVGAIMVPINYRLSPPEVAHVINDSGAKALAYTPEFAEQVHMHKGEVPGVEAYVYTGEGEEALNYDNWVSSHNEGEPGGQADVSDDDPLFIMYTSGTTGLPKGAVITHGNTLWNAINGQLAYNLSRKDTSLVVTPLYHIGGLSVGATPAIFSGGKIILGRFFDPQRALDLIGQHKVSIMFGIPTMFQMMADTERFESTDFSSVRFFIAGGAPCPVPLIEQYLAKGVTFNQGYGLTETAPGVTALQEEDALRKRGSAGKPLFFVDVEIVDENDMVVEHGDMGEIVVKGPNVFKGYWNDPEATRRALKHGWFHTGDIGYFGPEGNLYITDRQIDMIISGGENIYPAEVERVIRTHPAVEDVGVIGMPHEKWGEAPLALVIKKKDEEATEEELMDFCKDKLARFKTPKKVIFVDDLPQTSTGKVIKKELREKYL